MSYRPNQLMSWSPGCGIGYIAVGHSCTTMCSLLLSSQAVVAHLCVRCVTLLLHCVVIRVECQVDDSDVLDLGE